MGLGDGGRGQTECCDAGAGSGAGGQVAGHGEGLGRQGDESDLVAPAGEESPLGAVDAAGVVGEDGLQGVGHTLVGGAQSWQGHGRAGDDWWLAAVVIDGVSGKVTRGGFWQQKMRDNFDYRAANTRAQAATSGPFCRPPRGWKPDAGHDPTTGPAPGRTRSLS